MKRILVVDDDTKIAKALAIRLQAAGYESLTAINGLDAVDLVFTHKPDLIIMDIWMPVGIGFSVAQRLRTLGLGTIPIIFMTASKLRGLRYAARKLGAAGFFEKPYDSEQLLAAVSQALAAGPDRGSPEPQRPPGEKMPRIAEVPVAQNYPSSDRGSPEPQRPPSEEMPRIAKAPVAQNYPSSDRGSPEPQRAKGSAASKSATPKREVRHEQNPRH